MPAKTPISYVPALRFKAGEYRALSRIAADVADRIVPRLILPLPGERDLEEKRVLTLDEVLYKTGQRIGRHWPLRPAFVEPRFLFSAFGESDCAEWLPRIFAVARHHNAAPIPVATLDDMIGHRKEAFRLAISDHDATKLAIRISSNEIDSDLKRRVVLAMSTSGIGAHECAILLDFADADFSNVEAVAEFTTAAMETVQSVGLWQRVIFQGTNFPEKNPAAENSSIMIPRNEWMAWKAAVASYDNGSMGLVFGDYSADNAKLIFKSGGGVAIRHYRYCSDRDWYVVRGNADVRQVEAMRSVSNKILGSGLFAGRDFSSADDYIYATAKGLNAGGTATTWREMNTVHHITKVVADLGGMLGYSIQRCSVDETSTQHTLFEVD